MLNRSVWMKKSVSRVPDSLLCSLTAQYCFWRLLNDLRISFYYIAVMSYYLLVPYISFFCFLQRCVFLVFRSPALQRYVDGHCIVSPREWLYFQASPFLVMIWLFEENARKSRASWGEGKGYLYLCVLNAKVEGINESSAKVLLFKCCARRNCDKTKVLRTSKQENVALGLRGHHLSKVSMLPLQK